MDSEKERAALQVVMERHLNRLLDEAGGKLSIAELEQVLLGREGPLMLDLFQTLVEHRQTGDFPPGAPTKPQRMA